MAKKQKAIIDDGFNAELVETAFFDGILEIPRLERPEKIIIPTGMVPFSARNRSKDNSEHVVFYEHDIEFADVLRNPDKYINDLNRFPGVVTLDCSLYIDMPLSAQIGNVYRSRAIGHYFQKNGLYVIPNVRWGDERSYTTIELPEKFAFLGLPKGSIVSVGTYGCVKSKEERFQFRSGLIEMLNELEPIIVLVYGAMPNDVFEGLRDKTRFINYSDWTSTKKGSDW